MALSGIEIFKRLPKTNCKECGKPTCLAFAMDLAVGKKEYTECNYLSDETRAFLEDALTPPIRTIKLSNKTETFKIGGETVLYRHEKRFENPPLFGLIINDNDDAFDEKLESFINAQFIRIEQLLKVEAICVNFASCNVENYVNQCSKVFDNTDSIVILKTDNKDSLVTILTKYADRHPVIYTDFDVLDLCEQYDCALISTQKNSYKNTILDITDGSIKDSFKASVTSRREALINKNKEYSYPNLVDASKLANGDKNKETLIASLFINKYASIILLDNVSGEVISPLLVQRMNIFSDPQRPHTTAEGIYEIGKPNSNSPVFITTNFALTYFIVSGELESARLNAYLLIQNTDGLSVMTAWAASKFNAENIAALVNKSGINEKVDTKELILPGYIAMEKDELQALLPEWKITCGPIEANQISNFMRNR